MPRASQKGSVLGLLPQCGPPTAPERRPHSWKCFIGFIGNTVKGENFKVVSTKHWEGSRRMCCPPPSPSSRHRIQEKLPRASDPGDGCEDCPSKAVFLRVWWKATASQNTSLGSRAFRSFPISLGPRRATITCVFWFMWPFSGEASFNSLWAFPWRAI